MRSFTIKKLVFTLSLTLIITHAHASETSPVSSPAKRIKLDRSCTLLATPHDDIISIIAADIGAAQPNGYIGIESPSLSNKEIINALTSAAERGVKVKIFVNDPNKEQSPNRHNEYRRLKAIPNISLAVIKNLHTKRIVIKKNIADQDQDKMVYIGFLNMTQNSPHNHEIMTRCTDAELFKESFGDQQRLGKSYYDRGLQKPFDLTARSIMHSSYPEAHAFKKQIIDQYVTCSHPEDYLYVAMYRLDDPEIIQTIINAKQHSGKPVTVILDGENWQKSPNKIKHLVQSGVDVYIYNKGQCKTTACNYPKSMHIKAILRKCNQTCLSVISTANLTIPSREKKINQDLWEPCSSEFSEQLKSILDTIIAECERITPGHFPA